MVVHVHRVHREGSGRQLLVDSVQQGSSSKLLPRIRSGLVEEPAVVFVLVVEMMMLDG
jgi:hypothetical protein